MFTSEREYISNQLDELWERMEALVEARQTASYECWTDIDSEYIELEGLYHKLLDKLGSLQP